MVTRTLDVLFRVCLALFLLSGLIVVAVQAIALVTGAGSAVENVVD